MRLALAEIETTYAEKIRAWERWFRSRLEEVSVSAYCLDAERNRIFTEEPNRIQLEQAAIRYEMVSELAVERHRRLEAERIRLAQDYIRWQDALAKHNQMFSQMPVNDPMWQAIAGEKKFPEISGKVYNSLMAGLMISLATEWVYVTTGDNSFDSGLVLTLAMMLAFCLLTWCVFVKPRAKEKADAVNAFSRRLVEIGLARYANGPGESAYAKMVTELLRVTQANETIARELLPDLNDLLKRYRELQAKFEYYQQEISHFVPEDLTADYHASLAQINETTDPTTRAAYAKSAELIAGRIESSRAQSEKIALLRRQQQRIAAQQEVIIQIFASVRASFSHQHTALMTDAETISTVENLSDDVAQVQSQTRAVEQAIEELAVLRLGR